MGRMGFLDASGLLTPEYGTDCLPPKHRDSSPLKRGTLVYRETSAFLALEDGTNGFSRRVGVLDP